MNKLDRMLVMAHKLHKKMNGFIAVMFLTEKGAGFKCQESVWKDDGCETVENHFSSLAERDRYVRERAGAETKVIHFIRARKRQT